jgi:hypothetical protein
MRFHVTTVSLRLWGVLLLMVAASGCGDGRSVVAPARLPQASPPVPVAGPPAGQSSGLAAGTYAAAVALDYPVRGYTLASRFVLREDGSFVLQYPHVEYRGTYVEREGTVVFSWEGWSTAGPWEATGVLEGATLRVRYNIVMSLSDFEDAVYTRVP